MASFIDVILPIPLEKRFTYSVTQQEARTLVPGMRVAVPFGRTKIYTGVVTDLHEQEPETYQAKPVEEVLDRNPVVTQEQLDFWQWISSYYMCTEGEVLRAALPGAFLLESETIVRNNPESAVDQKSLSDDEFLLYEALQRQSALKISEISEILGKKNVLPVVKGLVEKQIVIVNQEIREQYKPKMERYVQLHSRYSREEEMRKLLEELERAPRQREVIFGLFGMAGSENDPVKASLLLKKTKSSSATLRTLITKDIVQEIQIEVGRLQRKKGNSEKVLSLNEPQQQALEEIRKTFQKEDVCLLHGVTSSGKTELYIELIKKTISEGKQVLYLLPEIALTTQLITRLREHFGEKVVVYHSRYTLSERVEVYQYVLEGSSRAQIIIGARSSLFLPFRELGLVIVDEEHESSFKQFDPAPRYNARDSAVVLAKQHGARVLMGSATPSLESFFNADHGKYGMVSLKRRYGDVLLPRIEVVDLKDKIKRKRMTGHFSDRLLEEMQETFDNQEQVILFQNRRGFSPIVECNTCGHSPQCPNCDVSLTFHRHNDQLRCHYCGYHMALQQRCMACGSPDLSTKGFGTEQVESELKVLFPDRNVARMDLDTTRGKYSYEKIISAFEGGEIDVLVGTQMLTKGLDFRNVRLVGIMSADALLNYPDFRAHERSFQLMLQVAGRAGRTNKQGLVLIQTYNPYHRIVQQVSTNNYEEMYHEQTEERRQYKYPPYFRLIRFTLRARDFNRTNEAAEWLAAALRNNFKENVLGPEYPPVARIRNEYHKNIMLKIPQNQSLSGTKNQVRRMIQSFRAIAPYRAVKLVINVDPY